MFSMPFRVFLTAALISTSSVAATSVESFAGGDEPPSHGTITYQGTYGGEIVTQSRKESKTKEQAGALSIQMKFDGPAIEAVIKATGTMRDVRITGVRSGTNCKLFQRNGVVYEGSCTRSAFNGTIESPDGERLQIRINFNSNASTIVNDR